MKFMDKLPTVISCCFCCFLRAGCVLIAVFSFIVGVLFAPNVSQSKGYWDMNVVLSNYSDFTEMIAQMTLGIASIMLCVASGLLLIGSCCNIPVLIEIYQWIAIIYSSTLIVLFVILAIFCFFVHNNCILAGAVLCFLIVVIALLTVYFLIVTNSLRMSIKFLSKMESCMGLASIRVGMMLIAVLSMTTGAVVLGVVEQRTNICFENVMHVYGNMSNVTQPMQVVPYIRGLLSTTLVFMSFVFMIAGMTLLFSTLTDQEGFAQMFVWLVFLNVVIGFIMVISIGYQCAYLDFCILGKMDWLSSAATLLMFVAYLILWYYFCCVANSYVLEPHV